jgi:O-antigen/teichoic acid export membrane protein
VISWRHGNDELLDYLAPSNEIRMALKKNLSLMGITTVARLGAGLVTFSVLARLLGPVAFGTLMLWLSVAVLLSIIANYGLTVYVVRKVSLNPETAEEVLNEGFTAKLMLTIALFMVVAIGVFRFDLDTADLLLILLAGCIADTFTEFINAGFRARDKFATETNVSTIFAFIHTIIVSSAVIWHPSIEVAAIAYTASRVTLLVVTIMILNHVIAPLQLASFRKSIRLLCDARSYAVDFSIQSLFGQVDSVALNHFLGPASVGLYQAGMRLFLGGFQVAPILANVFLHHTSAIAYSPVLFQQANKQLHIAFLGTGIVFGLLLAGLADPLVLIIFGPSYMELIPLMPYFGLLLFLRFAAASWGVVLTAAGQQTFRTIVGLFHWGLIAAFASILIPALGIEGWLISLCVGTFALGLTYAIRSRFLVINFGGILGTTAFGGLCFVPFLHIW